jgi:hypothetical protein
MTRTRLSRRLEKRSKKTFFLAVIGIIIIFYLLLKFGVVLLANFSLYISGIGNKQETTKSNSQSYVSPPVLNAIPDATNSARLIISGSGSGLKGVEILLFINDEEIDSQPISEKGTFSFAQKLNKGLNEIKVKAKINNKESEFSDVFNVTYQDKAPELTIDSPSDGQHFGKGDGKVLVTGKTDANTSVTVNDFWAVTDENNQYSYTLNLKDGDNQINIVATDLAGNKTEKSIKVSYSQ